MKMRRYLLGALAILLLGGASWAAFKAIGKVTITTSGTPVKIYAGTPVSINGAFVIIQVPADQTGPNIYVGDSTLNKTTRAGVAAVLTPGQSITLQAPADARINPEDIWVDSDHSGDSVQVSVIY